MKKALFFIAVILMAATSRAQPFQVGTNVVNAGIGIGTHLGGVGKARPAIIASFEHGKWEVGGPGVISLGGYIGNTGHSYRVADFSYKWSYIVLGARSAYHYNGIQNLPELDLYGGLMLSYSVGITKAKGDEALPKSTVGGGLGFSGFIGGRWFFNPSWGAYAEIGYGASTLSLGASYKF